MVPKNSFFVRKTMQENNVDTCSAFEAVDFFFVIESKLELLP